MEIINLQNVRKVFDNNEVIKNCNMSVKKGSIYGFLGRNGAGKTTVLKLIATKIGFIKMSVQTTIVSAIIIASCSANVISTMSYTNFPFLFLWGIMAIISIISYCNIVHKTIRMDI